jgi:hypothetical protein
MVAILCYNSHLRVPNKPAHASYSPPTLKANGQSLFSTDLRAAVQLAPTNTFRFLDTGRELLWLKKQGYGATLRFVSRRRSWEIHYQLTPGYRPRKCNAVGAAPAAAEYTHKWELWEAGKATRKIGRNARRRNVECGTDSVPHDGETEEDGNQYPC